jgi:RHS repeat-associated protein
MLSAGVTTQFTYDNNGSMLSRSNGLETVTYDWINDGENRLVGVNSTDAGGSQSVNYVYDAQGNRVASIGDGVRTNYLVTPGGLSQVLAEYDSNGLVTRDYTYGLGLVRSVEGGSDSFYHTDGLGSVRMLTDTTGLVSDTYTYDAYGMSLSNSDGSYQFAGERRDAETGLDYLRARYYDPELGRFISKDAFAGFLNDPMSQHDYQYAHANPVNNTDPTGYFTLQDASTTVAFAGILASLSGSLGYVGGSYLTGNGPSGEELLNMADQWVAGFAHFASFGISTNIRSNLYGETATQNHSGFLWNMGNLAGAGMSLLMGAKVPNSLSFKMGRSEWLATIYEGISWGTSAWETGSNIREGRLEWTDSFNLLPFVSYGMSSKGVKAFLGTVREIDGRLRDWGKMTVVAFEEASPSGGKQIYVPDLSHVTGKTSRNRNRAIQSIIKEDFPDLNLTYIPEYNPFIRTGIAKINGGTQLGKNVFSSRSELRNTIVHEELHHRWWKRDMPRPHHSREFIPNEKFYDTIERYERIRGWKNY